MNFSVPATKYNTIYMNKNAGKKNNRSQGYIARRKDLRHSMLTSEHTGTEANDVAIKEVIIPL